MNDATFGRLRVASETLGTIKRALPEHIDLFIGFPTWEARSVAIFEALRFNASSALTFDFHPSRVKDLPELREVHRHSREKWEHACQDLKQASIEVKLSRSTEPYANCALVIDQVRHCAEKRGEPITVLLDITSMPKVYALAILGLLLRFGYAHSIWIFYAGGKYGPPAAGVQAATGTPFTEGPWRPIAVPFFEGKVSSSRRRWFGYLMGAEGEKALQILRAYDPDRIALVAPMQGDKGPLDTEVDSQASAIAKEFDDRFVQRFVVRPWALIDIVYDLDAAIRDARDYEKSVLCGGTKMHSMAAAVLAMMHDDLGVICRVPVAYVPRRVTWTGQSELLHLSL